MASEPSPGGVMARRGPRMGQRQPSGKTGKAAHALRRRTLQALEDAGLLEFKRRVIHHENPAKPHLITRSEYVVRMPSGEEVTIAGWDVETFAQGVWLASGNAGPIPIPVSNPRPRKKAVPEQADGTTH